MEVTEQGGHGRVVHDIGVPFPYRLHGGEPGFLVIVRGGRRDQARGARSRLRYAPIRGTFRAAPAPRGVRIPTAEAVHVSRSLMPVTAVAVVMWVSCIGSIIRGPARRIWPRSAIPLRKCLSSSHCPSIRPQSRSNPSELLVTFPRTARREGDTVHVHGNAGKSNAMPHRAGHERTLWAATGR